MRCQTLEHSCTFHLDQTHYGYMSGGGAAPGSTGFLVVVGTGMYGPGGDSGVVKGSRDEQEGGR